MIQFCRDCGSPMSLTYHFEEGKSTTYFLCKKCYYSTKPKALNTDRLFNDDLERKRQPLGKKNKNTISLDKNSRITRQNDRKNKSYGYEKKDDNSIKRKNRKSNTQSKGERYSK